MGVESAVDGGVGDHDPARHFDGHQIVAHQDPENNVPN